MNSNWFKLVMEVAKVRYGKKLLPKGVPRFFNKGDATLTIRNNCTIKSSFLSNLVELYSRTIIVNRSPGDGCVGGAVSAGKFEANSVIVVNPVRVINKLEGVRKWQKKRY